MSAVIKKSNVQLASNVPAAGARRPAASASPCVNRVRAVRVGDVVAAIEVTCTCGETTIIELDYPKHSEERDVNA